MDALASAEILLFEEFRLDRRAGGLFRRDESGEFVPVPIGSRALDILDSLIARAGEVVSKDEIIAAVWPGLVVEDSNLTVQISALRRVLDRGRTQSSVIQTVPGRGYRFVAEVTHPAGEESFFGLSVRPEAGADVPASTSPIAVPRRRNSVLIAFAAGFAAVVIALSAWWLPPTTQRSPAATFDPGAADGTALVDRRAALCQPEQQAQPAIFC